MSLKLNTLFQNLSKSFGGTLLQSKRFTEMLKNKRSRVRKKISTNRDPCGSHTLIFDKIRINEFLVWNFEHIRNFENYLGKNETKVCLSPVIMAFCL